MRELVPFPDSRSNQPAVLILTKRGSLIAEQLLSVLSLSQNIPIDLYAVLAAAVPGALHCLWLW